MGRALKQEARSLLSAGQACPPPPRGKGKARGARAAGVGAAARAAGAGSAALAASASIAVVEEEEEEGEEDEETEEAQVCWSMAFAFLPVLCEVGAEFFGAAMEAGICQYLLMLLLPLWSAMRALFGIVAAPPAPPANAPPAPPPTPTAPDLVTSISVGIFEFAERHPVYYLLVDFSAFFTIALFFLYLKDINEWLEARQQAARQAEEDKSQAELAKVGYQKLEEEEKAPVPATMEEGRATHLWTRARAAVDANGTSTSFTASSAAANGSCASSPNACASSPVTTTRSTASRAQGRRPSRECTDTTSQGPTSQGKEPRDQGKEPRDQGQGSMELVSSAQGGEAPGECLVPSTLPSTLPSKWGRAKGLAAAAKEQREQEEEANELISFDSAEVKSAAEMARELRVVIDRCVMLGAK